MSDAESIADEQIEGLSDEDLNDEQLQSDTWIEELECALLADCDPATLKKISEGRRIPANLRLDYWRALLALNDAGQVKLSGEFDLENQLEIRQDCEKLVDEISNNRPSEPLSEPDKLRLRSDFESTLTTYVKARPELGYVSDNGWIDILRVLHHLEPKDTQLYQLFFRIVDRYIPKDLSCPSRSAKQMNSDGKQQLDVPSDIITSESSQQKTDDKQHKEQMKKVPSTSQMSDKGSNEQAKSSIQAYHLLRLLIQYHDPELCSILDSKKVTPNLYVRDWFCSLFARSCSPGLALPIWDMHFKMADPFLIFFAAIVMVVNASEQLKKSNMTQAKMLEALKVMPSQLVEDDVEDLYYLVSNHYTNSTPRSIRSYSHLFFMDTFGNTYLGNESPEDGQHLLDLKTTQLTSSLDLSQYLCLPVVPAEIFSLDTAQLRSSPTQQASCLKYFLVDCRPAEQYNAGHLRRAFHLDCSLMLREPSSFSTAVKALLDIQRQVVESKSNAGGQHLCFIGSGQEEEDQYVNMVVASFLQKYQKYVSIVVGGFGAIHDYVSSKSELMASFGKYIVDHNPDLCKACYYSKNGGFPAVKDQGAAVHSPNTGGSAQSLLGKLASNQQAAVTASILSQSGATMFDKFRTAFVSKSSVIKDRLVETLNTSSIPAPSLVSSGLTTSRSHVSSQDKLGRRYMGNSLRYAIDDGDDIELSEADKRLRASAIDEPGQEIQLESWQKQMKITALYKCSQIKANVKYPGYVALSKTHLWILREIAHNKGFASVAAKRPLDMIVQITSKRRQPDLIIFRYGFPNQQQQSEAKGEMPAGGDKSEPSKSLPPYVASDQLHIPQAFEVIRLIKREIVRIMDENSKTSSSSAPNSRA